jgi:N-terminal acetyltransferase B complex catalytic subunit
MLLLCAALSLAAQVIGYYSGEEDAYDMRKSLPRDPDKTSMQPLGRKVLPEELEW